jgi:hypothetical protein
MLNINEVGFCWVVNPPRISGSAFCLVNVLTLFGSITYFWGALINGAVTLFVDPGRMGNMINKIGDFSSRNHPETQWIVSFCTW